MKKVLRFVGQVLVIAAITLALDFVLTATLFSSIKRALVEAEASDYGIYHPAPYHHDLVPDMKITRVWGNVLYPWRTDRYAFRTGECAPGEAQKDWPAIFVIGDSFTEALGSSYEKSFVGLMACDAATSKPKRSGISASRPTVRSSTIARSASPPSDWA